MLINYGKMSVEFGLNSNSRSHYGFFSENFLLFPQFLHFDFVFFSDYFSLNIYKNIKKLGEKNSLPGETVVKMQL